MKLNDCSKRLLTPQTLKAMKLTFILLTVIFLQVSAKGVAQNNVTFSGKKVKLETVFKAIEKQTGFAFFYKMNDLANANPVSVELKNTPLGEALTILLKDQPLTFSISGKTIVIKEKPSTTAVFQPADNSLTNSPPPIDIHGRVVNEKGEPVIASVQVKGTNKGTTTNDNGEFELKGVDDNATLVISGVSIETFEMKVNGRNDLVLNAKVRVESLNEVVINKGYYSVRQRENTGDVSKVTEEDIRKQPISNPLEALEGRMPGVFIQQTSGMPGGAFNLQIRGQNSIRTLLNSSVDGNLPLYVIDGVPFSSGSLSDGNASNSIIPFSSPLNTINPTDIESIEVLKDADATAIYGSRGANGVVLINTKKGKAGKTKVDVSLYHGTGNVTRKMNLLNTEQYLQMRHEALKNDGQSLHSYDYDINGTWDTTRYTDWQSKLIGGTSQITNVQSSISGGNVNTQFIISGGYSRQGTVLPFNFEDKKASAHFSLNHTSENLRFKSLLTTSYISDLNNLPAFDPTSLSLTLPPDAPDIFLSDGTLNWSKSSWTNPFSYFFKKYKANTTNLIANSTFSYQLLKGLCLKTSLGYNDIQVSETSTSPIASKNPAFNPTGSATFGDNRIKTWIIEPQVEYQNSFKKAKFGVLLGSTFQQNETQGQSILASGYTTDALIENILSAPTATVLNSNYVQYRYNAVFARVNFSLLDKYFINLTGRRDGSSRFGSGKQFGNFGAVGIGWIFSQEKLGYLLLPFISYGKLKASYGTTGSDQIGDYGYLDSYTSTTYSYNGEPGLMLTRLVNPNFSWETNKKIEAALELGFIKDRVFITAGFYKNRSSNQLVGYSIPAITGQTSIQANLAATVQNSGWELTLKTINLKSKSFNWFTSFNISLPENKLLSYPNLMGSSYKYSYVVGQPLNIKYGFRIQNVDPQTGVYQYSDKDGHGIASPIFPDDYIFTKDVGPKFYGGIQNSLSFGRFQLDIFVQFVKQSGTNYLNYFAAPGFFSNQPDIVLNRWQKPGDQSLIEKFTQSGGSPARRAYRNLRSSDAIITDASYLRFKNVYFSYEIPAKNIERLKLKAIKIFAQGQNLLTKTNYLGPDPENQSFNSIPPLRIITGGIQVTF